MNTTVIPVEMLIFAALFTAIVFMAARNDKKYSAQSIHNYPPDIQEEYFKTHEKMEVTYRSKKVILSKVLGILLFTGIILVCALCAGAQTFAQGFLLALLLMMWIGAYDTFFLDWVLFANLPMFRLEGTEHMDKAYHQKWFHLKGILFPGSLFGVIVSLLVGLLVTLVK